jgi:uracil permease
MSAGKMAILGIQHMFAMFGSTVLVPILTGLNPAVALFAAGIGTLLFHFITGRKVPVFLGSSFAFIGAIIGVATMYSNGAEVGTPAYMEGLQYATGGIIIAGLIYVVLALVVKFVGPEAVVKLIPPVVAGPIIIIIGLMLAPVAISNIAGGTGTPLINWLIGGITIATIVVVSVFAKGFYKLVPIIFGIVAGYIASLLFVAGGLFSIDFTSITQATWFQLPDFFLPKFDGKAILLIAPLAIVTFVEHIGDITANGAVTGKDYMNDPGLHRTLLGDGIATMFAGFVGGPANTTYSENTGVLAATGNYNPVTLEIAACFALVFAFLGKFAALLSTLPTPVIGGVSIVCFGMIATVGLRTIVNGKVDLGNSRNMLIVAIMLVMGLGGAVFQITESLSFSGVALAAIIGIVLNLILPERFNTQE